MRIKRCCSQRQFTLEFVVEIINWLNLKSTDQMMKKHQPICTHCQQLIFCLQFAFLPRGLHFQHTCGTNKRTSEIKQIILTYQLSFRTTPLHSTDKQLSPYFWCFLALLQCILEHIIDGSVSFLSLILTRLAPACFSAQLTWAFL